MMLVLTYIHLIMQGQFYGMSYIQSTISHTYTYTWDIKREIGRHIFYKKGPDQIRMSCTEYHAQWLVGAPQIMGVMGIEKPERDSPVCKISIPFNHPNPFIYGPQF